MVSKYDYSVTPGDRLGRPLAKELAALFSSAYGKWSRKSPVNPGGRIRLGADYYLKNYGNGLFRIATCRAGTRLIAQAVYLERDTPRGRVSLVVQLVVDAEFRRQGVATTLLHAIWGFSDFYAWGIVTSSPCTVEALEAATFRRCNAGLISRRAAFVAREVLARVPFLASAPWCTDGSSSAVDSKFFTDRSAKPVARRRVERRLGRLAEGEEWLALTFRDQDLDLEDAYSQIVGCSGRFVAEAYRRQPQAR
jgi:GNAT superfamily N-acetyltransferase